MKAFLLLALIASSVIVSAVETPFPETDSEEMQITSTPNTFESQIGSFEASEFCQTTCCLNVCCWSASSCIKNKCFQPIIGAGC